MKNQVVKNWLLMAAGMICGITALILLMAEPNGCDSFTEWLGVLIASKIGAVVCLIVCYWVFERLTKEIKNK
jgi:uncharacterized membrane protein